MVSIYDAKTLKLIKEITLPGRDLVTKKQNFDLSASGARAYVYILLPVASGGTIEIPGCALVFLWALRGRGSRPVA